MNKRLLWFLALGLQLAGCSLHTTTEPGGQVNAYLENGTLIWPPSTEEGDITMRGHFEEQVELEKIKDGDWLRYLFKITYSDLEILKGEWQDPQITFLCTHSWPTEESGIMVKAIPWPFREGEQLIFEVKLIDDRPTIIGYREP
jgi:hypothetical protein